MATGGEKVEILSVRNEHEKMTTYYSGVCDGENKGQDGSI
jgi:hypothetical protein